MKYDEAQEMQCPICGKTIRYEESLRGNLYYNDDCVAAMTKDCHGIPFRTVCLDCFVQIQTTKGFDGEVYTELDENIEPD